jgi:2-amino-4-hydroxy-6-hydroxymethyldihydropteridine diphosphokinase
MAARPRTDCVIGLGANLGERRASMRFAVRACSRLGQIVGVSALYETEPVGGPPQPRYLNAAVRLRTGLGAEPLWHRLVEIEVQAGRARRERWGPRVLDLDILWIRRVCIVTDRLQIPHPRLVQRAFAILPLLDVAPEAVHPTTGEAFSVVAARLDSSGVRLLDRGSSWAALDA